MRDAGLGRTKAMAANENEIVWGHDLQQALDAGQRHVLLDFSAAPM
jgi:hypothetical protein